MQVDEGDPLQVPVTTSAPPHHDVEVTVLRVLVIDDHLAFAEALSVRLGAERDLEVIGCATTAPAGEAAASRLGPDVALVDVELGTDDGLELVSRICSDRLRVVVLTCHEDAETACAAFNAGASGFVTKDSPAEELVEAIRRVDRGETWIPPRLLTAVLNGLRRSSRELGPEEELLDRLSPREREVLTFMVAGMDRARIAREMFLSTNTVRTHTQNLLSKLDVHSTLEAVSVALRGGVRPTADK